MKGYIYTPAELGLESFSDGILHLNVEETRDPDEADIFICPEPLFKFTDKGAIGRFPYFTDQIGPVCYERAAPHVFLDLSEHFTTYTVTSPIFIRAALTKAMLDYGPNSISWPWPVKDYSDCIVPVGGFKYDVTFHGWLSNLVRKVSVKSCQQAVTEGQLTSYIRTYPNFFGYQSADEQAARDKQYRQGLRSSRIVLTQESIPGVIPYRFYEAMSAGRCQLYIGRNYNLPFADKINYHTFVNFLDVDRADEAHLAVQDWLKRYPDSALIEKGMRARQMWEQWLQPDKWVDLMTLAVEEKLEEIRDRSRP